LEPHPLNPSKSELRARLKPLRSSLTENTRAAYSKAIMQQLLSLPEVRDARTLFVYISYGNEVDTHGLLRHFLDTGKDIAVPKILPSKNMIATPFDSWADLRPGTLGILTPSGNEIHPGPFDLVITPGLGFTLKGHRIGYGRGYYDRWFAGHHPAKKIGFAFEAQIIEDIPCAGHDIPVDILITEKRIITV
jgi:5,10-methenyltetrahydrofolate synthetase